MKIKLYITVLFVLVCYCKSFGQITYYIPGTGTAIKTVDFENANLLTQKFAYGTGWAGTGFGLTGTQRGAPEVISVITNPQQVSSSGNQVLAFRSQDRDAAWYEENPSAVGTTVYGVPDTESQDDFFMTGANWVASEIPSVMMHVYLPSTVGDDGVTSLRLVVKFDDPLRDSWPGIWCYGNRFVIRGAGRSDISIPTNAPNNGKDTWWTLGLSVAPDGDVQYYATPSFVATLLPEHCLGFNSVLSASNSLPYYPVVKMNDAVIMTSNRNLSQTPTLIDFMSYTKGAQQIVLSVTSNNMKSITMYPNPTSNYLYVKGLPSATAYKIFDSLGRVVKIGSVTSSSNGVQVDSLSNGLYFLSLDGFGKKTFIKE